MISFLSTSDIGPILTDIIGDVIPIVAHCTHPEQDPELRLKYVILV